MEFGDRTNPEAVSASAPTPNMKERKVSCANLRRDDSLDLEAGHVTFSDESHSSSNVNWSVTLALAFQCIGVVYGDLGTSPMYVYASTFPDGITHTDDVLAVFSLIIYTILLSPMIKYMFIVLQANDNGNGGAFALYSLICRHAKVSLVPNQQPEDTQLSNYNLDTPSSGQVKRAQKIKQKLEHSKTAQLLLLFLTILGTSFVIGDGILTPCMTVLSAVGGINSLGEEAIVAISVAIVIILFSCQRFGTDKVGYTFAPILFVWFLFISGIGVYNLFKHGFGIFRAFNPKYLFYYFQRNGKKGWISLGGVILCITGTEAMFADLGHFNVRAIQISFSGLVFPTLVATYSGQAAYLMKFPEHVKHAFYKSVPGPVYWPTFVVAVAAAIIASQSMISAAFSIISQALNLGCFPRVKVVHTSKKHGGQVYIPELSYMLMVACVIVTVGFKTPAKLASAYGIAVNCEMIISTCLVTLIMLFIWKSSIWRVALFFGVIFSVEGIYLSAMLSKFSQGGYLPFTVSLLLVVVMGTWHYVHKQRYMFELRNKVSSDFIKDLSLNPNINRVPGIGLLFSDLVQGIPPVFHHLIDNIPSIHSVFVFVSLKSIPISKVEMEERFLFRQIEPREYWMFRCVVRYGYNDAFERPEEFVRLLVENLKEFIRQEHSMREAVQMEVEPAPLVEDGKVCSPTVYIKESLQQCNSPCVSSQSVQSFNVARSGNNSIRVVSEPSQGAEEEIQLVQKAMDNGVVYLLGEAEVIAQPNSSFFKKFVVNYVYNFLRKNFRQRENVMAIPRSRLLKIGMTYEI